MMNYKIFNSQMIKKKQSSQKLIHYKVMNFKIQKMKNKIKKKRK